MTVRTLHHYDRIGLLSPEERGGGYRRYSSADLERLHRIACSTEIHRGLADLYLADERFSSHYGRRAEGLARYVHEAIQANADRA